MLKLGQVERCLLREIFTNHEQTLVNPTGLCNIGGLLICTISTFGLKEQEVEAVTRQWREAT